MKLKEKGNIAASVNIACSVMFHLKLSFNTLARFLNTSTCVTHESARLTHERSLVLHHNFAGKFYVSHVVHLVLHMRVTCVKRLLSQIHMCACTSPILLM